MNWGPAHIQESASNISITAYATLGNKELLDHAPANDVYVHVGAIARLSSEASDWKYAKFIGGHNQWSGKCSNYRRDEKHPVWNNYGDVFKRGF